MTEPMSDEISIEKILSELMPDNARRVLDEIERLRGVIDRAGKAWLSLEPGVAWEGDLGDAMAAAVAEIERLREETEQLHKREAGWAERIEDYKAENAQLRARVAELGVDKEETIRACAAVIRKKCDACENGTYSTPGPDPDPVECEYCGRPMRAVLSLLEVNQ